MFQQLLAAAYVLQEHTNGLATMPVPPTPSEVFAPRSSSLFPLPNHRIRNRTVSIKHWEQHESGQSHLAAKKNAEVHRS